tara:strand:- start:1275 stop:1520 length:246 start_codon:yes stop_codon:yes gene_type:complete
MSYTYAIFNCSELNTIDFSQVLETSIDTVRKSIDETLTFVKYEGTMPSSVTSLTTIQGTYTYSEILPILSGNVWSNGDAPE